MPRLLQEALRFSRAEEEGGTRSEGKVVSRRKTNRNRGRAACQRVGPDRVLALRADEFFRRNCAPVRRSFET